MQRFFLLFKCNDLGAFYIQYAFGGCQVQLWNTTNTSFAPDLVVYLYYYLALTMHKYSNINDNLIQLCKPHV